MTPRRSLTMAWSAATDYPVDSNITVTDYFPRIGPFQQNSDSTWTDTRGTGDWASSVPHHRSTSPEPTPTETPYSIDTDPFFNRPSTGGFSADSAPYTPSTPVSAVEIGRCTVYVDNRGVVHRCDPSWGIFYGEPPDSSRSLATSQVDKPVVASVFGWMGLALLGPIGAVAGLGLVAGTAIACHEKPKPAAKKTYTYVTPKNGTPPAKDKVTHRVCSTIREGTPKSKTFMVVDECIEGYIKGCIDAMHDYAVGLLIEKLVECLAGQVERFTGRKRSEFEKSLRSGVSSLMGHFGTIADVTLNLVEAKVHLVDTVRRSLINAYTVTGHTELEAQRRAMVDIISMLQTAY